MIPKPLEDVVLADIEALVANAVAESRTLEFKTQLPGPKDEQKREFLYDVCALANTDGGDLIFGVEEAKGGVAKAYPGAELTEPVDATIRRLEQLLASSVEPRLSGLRFRAFQLPKGTAVIVLRIPASFAAPHWAGIGGSRRFHRRNNNPKAEMDIHELRSSFAASEGFIPRLVTLHEEAIRQWHQADLPFTLEGGARATLSILPLGILREPWQLELDHTTAVYPVAQQQSLDWLTALEGFYVFGVSDKAYTNAYCLTRRSGQVDYSWLAGLERDGQRLMWPQAVEAAVNAAANETASKLAAFGIQGPFAVALTLVQVRGYSLYRDFFARKEGIPAWRDKLSLPLLVVDDLRPESLLPLARTFWLAMGEKRPEGPLGTVT
jgi:hypothetical protein